MMVFIAFMSMFGFVYSSENQFIEGKLKSYNETHMTIESEKKIYKLPLDKSSFTGKENLHKYLDKKIKVSVPIELIKVTPRKTTAPSP